MGALDRGCGCVGVVCVVLYLVGALLVSLVRYVCA